MTSNCEWDPSLPAGWTTHTRGLALFNLAIDSKLRGCDLVALRVKDVAHDGQIARRAIILQRKTQRLVQFEITDQTWESLGDPFYKRTKNLRAVQLLLGHTKLESTVRYLGIEVDDAWRLPSRQRFSAHSGDRGQ